MSISSTAVETLRLNPTGGCGSLESPWTGWEGQLEPDGPASEGRTFRLEAGFYAVSRAVRLASGTTLRADPDADGRAWFLPGAGAGTPLEALFVVDGADDVTLSGICLNGRDSRAAHGLIVRCGSGIHTQGCLFGDFRDEKGAALLIAGESEDRPVRGAVLQDCHILNGAVGLRLGPDATDLLVTENRFEEVSGPALLLDPQDRWTSYGLIFVKNRIRSNDAKRRTPFVRVLPGAEGIRLAENTFEGAATHEASAENGAGEAVGIDIHGGGGISGRRLEMLLNRFVTIPGAGIRARECGPGFLSVGNELTACGSEHDGSIQLFGCAGVLVEDNEIAEPTGPGIRLNDCRFTRVNGNDVAGHTDRSMPRAGTIGIRIDGEATRRVRVTDNKITGMRIAGVRVDDGRSIRVVGNEVEDSGEGIHVARGRNLLLVGNDCRDNGAGGLRVDRDVKRGMVALNYAILNGPIDLEVVGDRIRCHSNKVDREGRLPARS